MSSDEMWYLSNNLNTDIYIYRHIYLNSCYYQDITIEQDESIRNYQSGKPSRLLSLFAYITPLLVGLTPAYAQQKEDMFLGTDMLFMYATRAEQFLKDNGTSSQKLEPLFENNDRFRFRLTPDAYCIGKLEYRARLSSENVSMLLYYIADLPENKPERVAQRMYQMIRIYLALHPAQEHVKNIQSELLPRGKTTHHNFVHARSCFAA
ncbi:MAG: hypothetical protein HY832_03825 [Candidatus Aenigmarchaeota archaeon]|nr:hypothetical protein [Candidatus Aenigmarchaeota archaeon]